jgi:UDP-N-acetylmuramoyl-L-alanyl-D-glutamate--2,6-diaminopimelate ligase
MAASGCGHAVVELSSMALARRSAAGLPLDAAVLTNLRSEHLDYHGSTLNYRRAKAKVFDLLKPEGFAVANADDPASRHFVDSLECPLITVGVRSPAEMNATVVERSVGEQTFLLSAGSETVAVRTRLIGDHHVHNCLSAAAIGLVLGIELPAIARGLESVESLPGRLERIECGQPFGVFVDHGHSPDRLATSLNALRHVTRGRILCLYSPEHGGGRQVRPLLGRTAERLAHVTIIAGHGARDPRFLAIAHDVQDGYDRPARARVIPDRAKAIDWALGQARGGDTVLIAGGCPHAAADSTIQPFDDAEFARAWLYEAGARTLPIRAFQG